MTRTDVMASSRPQAVGVARTERGSSGALRGLLVLPILLAAIALAAPAVATAATSTSPTSSYNQEPNKPSTGTSPSKESKPTTTPTTSTPEPSGTAPSTQKASTLPFTGLDLRWIVGLGLLMMGAGFSIMVVQRRHGSSGGR